MGAASIVGTGVVAQEDGDDGGIGQDDNATDDDAAADLAQQPAVRVAHAAPDAPVVDVRLTQSAGTGVGGGTDDGLGNDTDGGLGNDTDDGLGGDDTSASWQQDGGNETGQDTQEETEITVEGVGYRNVSSYTEVEPGTYQVEILSAGDDGGILDSIFGGDDDGGDDGGIFDDGDDEESQDDQETSDETVVFEGEIEVQEGTTYTLVAYGELREAQRLPVEGDIGAPGDEMEGGIGDGTDDGLGGNETDGGDGLGGNESEDGLGGDETTDDGLGQDDGLGGNESDDGLGGNETDGGLGEDGLGQMGPDTSFQVDLLEDDLTDPGEGQTRVRVFHAVPDAQTLSISRADEASEGMGGNETDGGLGGNDTEGGDGLGGDDTSASWQQDENETGIGQDDDTDDGLGGNETDGGLGQDGMPAELPLEGLEFGDHETLELDAGDYTLEFRGGQAAGGVTDDGVGDGTDGGLGNDTDDGFGDDTSASWQQDENDTGIGQEDNATGGVGQDAEQVQEVEISLEANAVYSGFAIGYFDPEAAQQEIEAGQDGAGGNETDGGLGGNESDDGIGGDGNATDDGTGQEGEEVAVDVAGAGFEFVTVEDASEGERSDGGTGGGGILGDPVPASD